MRVGMRVRIIPRKRRPPSQPLPLVTPKQGPPFALRQFMACRLVQGVEDHLTT